MLSRGLVGFWGLDFPPHYKSCAATHSHTPALRMATSVSTRSRHADKLNKNLYKVNLVRYALFYIFFFGNRRWASLYDGCPPRTITILRARRALCCPSVVCTKWRFA